MSHVQFKDVGFYVTYVVVFINNVGKLPSLFHESKDVGRLDDGEFPSSIAIFVVVRFSSSLLNSFIVFYCVVFIIKIKKMFPKKQLSVNLKTQRKKKEEEIAKSLRGSLNKYFVKQTNAYGN